VSSAAPSGCPRSITTRSELAATANWTLSNGLRVVLQPNHRLPLVTLHVAYLAGSAADGPELPGLAHLSEHLAFSGPSNGSQLSWPAEIQQVGGLPSATTSYDRTTFSTVVASHHLNVALRVEAKRMSDATVGVSLSSLERQRRILLQESRQRASGRPATVALEEMQHLLFPPRHIYHHPPSGTAGGVEAADGPAVEEFLRQSYTPSNAVVALVGDVSRAEAEDACEHHFASIPTGPALLPASPVAFDSSPPRGERAGTLPVARTYVGYTIPGQGEAQWYASAVLAIWLAVGKSSSLRRQLVEDESVAQRIEAIRISRRHTSTLCIAAVGRPGVSSANLATALTEALESSLAQGPNLQQLNRARKKVLTDFYAEIQRAQRRADLLTWQMGYRDQRGEPRVESQRYDALGLNEVSLLCDHLRGQRGHPVLSYLAQGEIS